MRYTERSLVAMSAILVVAGLLVAFVARGAGPLPGDLPMTRFLQSLLPFDGLVGTVLVVAENAVWFLALLALVVALLLRRWVAALFVLLATATGTLLGDAFVKPLVARPRPSAGLVRVYEPADSYGFPSTTTLVACVLFGIVTYFVWYARQSRSVPRSATRRVLAMVATAALLLLLWISISRVYLGVHWATDVLGAWLFGGAWLLLLIAVHRWWLARRTKA